MLRELRTVGERIPYALFPEEEGIIPFGMTDNGDVLFWGAGSTSRNIIINEARSDEWENFYISFVDFIFG